MNHEDGGFDCPGCAWPDDPERPAPGHLRERHQARHLGADAQAGRPRLLRRPHRQRAGRLDRLRPRGRRAAGRADALRRRDRQVCPDHVGGRVRAGREHAARAGQPARGGVLHLRAAEQRGDVPVPAVGARVRDEQPARLLEHVPRGQRPGADGGDRDRQGDGRPARLGAGGRDLADGRERRHERAADAHLAGRGRPARAPSWCTSTR